MLTPFTIYLSVAIVVYIGLFYYCYDGRDTDAVIGFSLVMGFLWPATVPLGLLIGSVSLLSLLIIKVKEKINESRI